MLFSRSWLKGILSYRPGRLLGAVCGVALTVALLALIGAFIASGAASMVQHAVADLPVDWQVQLAPGSDASAVKAAIESAASPSVLEKVGYADVDGFITDANGTVQTTGPGKVLGISPAYRSLCGGEVRQLIGTSQGVLVAQQTAANLHVKVGDMVTIKRIGLPPVEVRVAGVVDLPYADSLFQTIGLPPGASPQAPPDNVLLLPDDLWHRLFDPQAAIRPDSVRFQFHVRIARNLPSDPNAAYTYVQRLANNLEARIAGSGVVGDNLAARLASVREDALYARALFLFLGLPGILLAALLTLSVAATGAQRRRQEQALLRVRGASAGQIMSLEAIEALVVGVGGVLLGLGLIWVAGRMIAPAWGAAGTNNVAWTAIASLIGFALAVVAVQYPAWVQARNVTVSYARAIVGRGTQPLWKRAYLDLILLALAAVEFWHTASTGYQIVLAPEGVPSVSIHYEAFIAPLCLWLGGALLGMRLFEGALDHGRRLLAKILSPLARNLSSVVATSLYRQRKLIIHGMILVALAVSFAVSTAVFNTTYNAQLHVDAELTNGSDVTVTGPTTSPPSSKLEALSVLPGIAAMQQMQHRFAYVGTDLQDIYGIDPGHIGEATNMSDAYFAGGNARTTLSGLATHPDGVLVSEETVKDFQLRPGDQLNLRLQNVHDHQYHVVPFHFVGIVREFPTAPRDSFLVANASYIAQQTGSGTAEIILIRSKGNPDELAGRIRAVVGPLAGVKVTDIGSAQRSIGSSLTAINLHGLTSLELIFAILMIAGSTGLILALGLAERRRMFVILAALGANDRQRGAFFWAEGLVILLIGGLIGAIMGSGIALTLVKVLTGVFDPPPEFLSIPWGYLALLAGAAITSMAVAVLIVKNSSQRPVVEELRNL